jgi:hypothetical protein
MWTSVLVHPQIQIYKYKFTNIQIKYKYTNKYYLFMRLTYHATCRHIQRRGFTFYLLQENIKRSLDELTHKIFTNIKNPKKNPKKTPTQKKTPKKNH